MAHCQRALAVSHFQVRGASIFPIICPVSIVTPNGSGNRTIHLWRILCMAYPEDFRRLAQNCDSCVTAPRYSLGEYINFLRNSISTWGVSLNVWTEVARVPELVDLASVTNLVSLEVNTTTTAQPDSLQELAGLNDRILRTWSEVATTSEAFKNLQVLRLYHQRDLSQQSFAYLSRLPSLMFCVLAKCDRLTDAAALKAAKLHGWVAANISDLQSTHCLSLAFSAPSSTGTRWCTEQQTSPSVTSDLPMINFSIGQRRTEVKDRDMLILQRVVFHDPPNTSKRDSSVVETAITSHDKVERTKRPKMRMRGKDLSGLLNGFL